MEKKLWFSLLLVLLVFSTIFYHAGNSSADGSSVKILEIDPDPSVQLNSGSEVHFKVKLQYTIIEDSATVNLLIQKGEYSSAIDNVLGSTQQVLNKGKGIIILEKTVKVPNTNIIQVFTPLMLPGETRTTIVDMKVYKVIK
jgi:hypothetical protein